MSVCVSAYPVFASWSHCKQTTASLRRPRRSGGCCRQMLRTWGRRDVVGTTADRLHEISPWNSSSRGETWTLRGAEPGRHYRHLAPSVDTLCTSEDTKEAAAWAPLRAFGRLGGNERVRRQAPPKMSIQRGFLRHFRIWRSPGQSANQSTMRLSFIWDGQILTRTLSLFSSKIIFL